MGEFHRPVALRDTLTLLARSQPIIMAGGTDLMRNCRPWPPERDVLLLSGISILSEIREAAGSLDVGANATWHRIAEAPLPSALAALNDVAWSIGSPQVRHVATIGGNVAGRLPWADSLPVLLVLGARPSLASTAGVREPAIEDFLKSDFAIRPDEVLTHLSFPGPPPESRSGFVRHANRTYQAPAIVSVALSVRAPQGRIEEVRVAVGSMPTPPVRLAGLEAELRGSTVKTSMEGLVAQRHLDGIAAGGGGASADYCRHVAHVLVRRLLVQLTA
jgi:CO/xanthine dehydrogenase FAD-binding subunit